MIVNYELIREGDINMYCSQIYTEARGDSNREGSDGLASGGSGPPPEYLGQLYLQGSFYSRLLGSLLGMGNGGREGGGGGANMNPALLAGLLSLSTNRSLKGTPPTIFDRNQKNMKQFMQDFSLY